MQTYAKIQNTLPKIQEEKFADVTTIELEAPSFLWIAPDLTSPFEKRPLQKKDNKLWINMGIENTLDVEWNVTTKIQKKSLKKLKAMKKDTLVKAGMSFVTEKELSGLKNNLSKTQNKLGFRYQGPQLGWSVFAKQKLKKGDCISYAAHLTIKKNAEIIDPKIVGDYAFALFFENEHCLISENGTGLDSGLLVQHAYGKNNLYDGKNWDIEKFFSLSEKKLEEIVTANATPKMYVFLSDDHLFLLPMLRLTTDMEAGQMIAWNYGQQFWLNRQQDPQLFLLNGFPLEKSCYEMPKTVTIKPTNSSEISCTLFAAQIKRQSQKQFMTVIIQGKRTFCYSGNLLTQALQDNSSFGAIIQHPLFISYNSLNHLEQILISAMQDHVGKSDHYAWKLSKDASNLSFYPKGLTQINDSLINQTLAALQKLNFEFSYIEDAVVRGVNFKWLQVATAEIYDHFILKMTPILEDKPIETEMKKLTMI